MLQCLFSLSPPGGGLMRNTNGIARLCWAAVSSIYTDVMMCVKRIDICWSHISSPGQCLQQKTTSGDLDLKNLLLLLLLLLRQEKPKSERLTVAQDSHRSFINVRSSGETEDVCGARPELFFSPQRSLSTARTPLHRFIAPRAR